MRMQGIRKRFGGTIALDGVDLAVRPGEVLALVGENGAGKSTLMKVLSGAHRADDGEMWLDGQPYAPRSPHGARVAGVAMIYQELALAPHLSVAENVLLGMEPTIGPFVRRSEMARRTTDALARLGHPDLDPWTKVGALPIAMRQLVEIARAVVVGCSVLVLDEPTSSLSAADIERLFKLVRGLRDQGKAIVYISHFLEEVKEIADRYVVLRDGVTVGNGAMATTPISEIIALMVGREVSELYPRSVRKAGDPILELRDLAGVSKPSDVSLTLRRGEVLGIAGLVSAGRTEMLRAVFGLDRVKWGEIRVGVHAGPASPLRRWRQGVGLLSEDRKEEGLALSLSIAENATLTKLGFWVSPRRQEELTVRWIDELQIKCRGPEQAVGDLSGGNQQKVALARLLHHDVDVLLLDEPTRGIDVGSKAQIYRLIDDLACRGKAVLMVSSYLPELMGVCDRVAVMRRGTLSEARRVEAWDEHAIMAEATASGGIT
jgi:ribose transport system ATP-binding protein